MKSLNHHFDKIICINLDRRTDRWAHVLEQCKTYGFTAERFEAHDGVLDHMGKKNGNAGCTASHRGVLELIAHNKWASCLVLEDDFHIIHPEFNEMLDAMMPEVPEDYDILYLGGHYGEPPISRVSPAVIRCGRMLTTSSYAITWQMARKMAPYISGVGPIDSLFGGFNRDNLSFIFHPRLMVQYPNYSDLQEREMDNSQCMQDTHHENLV